MLSGSLRNVKRISVTAFASRIVRFQLDSDLFFVLTIKPLLALTWNPSLGWSSPGQPTALIEPLLLWRRSHKLPWSSAWRIPEWSRVGNPRRVLSALRAFVASDPLMPFMNSGVWLALKNSPAAVDLLISELIALSTRLSSPKNSHSGFPMISA